MDPAAARSRLPQGKITVIRSATAAKFAASTSRGSAIQIRFEIPPREAFRPVRQAILDKAFGFASEAMNRRDGSREAQ